MQSISQFEDVYDGRFKEIMKNLGETMNKLNTTDLLRNRYNVYG